MVCSALTTSDLRLVGRIGARVGLALFFGVAGCNPINDVTTSPVAEGQTTDHIRVEVRYPDESPVDQAQLNIFLHDLDNIDPLTGEPWIRREINYLTGATGIYDRYVSYHGQDDAAADKAEICVFYNDVLCAHSNYDIREHRVIAIIRISP